MNLEYVISRCRHAAAEPSAEFVVSGLVAGELAALLEDLETARLSVIRSQDEAIAYWRDKANAAESKLASALEERDAAGKLAHGLEADVTDLQCELNDTKSRLDEATKELEYFQPAFEQTNEELVKTARALDEARSRLQEASELIANAVANHDGGGKCELDAVAAAVWLRDVENPSRCAHPTWLPFKSEDREYCAMCGEERERVVERHSPTSNEGHDWEVNGPGTLYVCKGCGQTRPRV